ncbi:hypothetical protein Hanom_Chr04g00296411 [Helianthus anomalus]
MSFRAQNHLKSKSATTISIPADHTTIRRPENRSLHDLGLTTTISDLDLFLLSPDRSYP